MKMISAGAGLGVGKKDYRVILVFENQRRPGVRARANSIWKAACVSDCMLVIQTRWREVIL